MISYRSFKKLLEVTDGEPCFVPGALAFLRPASPGKTKAMFGGKQ